MTVRVAAVQFRPVFGKKLDNLRKIRALVEQAASQGAELIVLPELAATGYSFLSKRAADAMSEVLDTDGAWTQRMAQWLAKALGVTLVIGLVEKDREAETLHNSQILVQPDGQTTVCRKINPWGNDFIWSKAGTENPPVIKITFRDGVTRKVGLLICRDARDRVNSTWTDLYEPGDADLVCLSANWGDGGFPAVTWMEFVENNKTALVVSNRYGRESCNNFGEGGVCVIDRDGTVHCDGLAFNQDCMVLHDVE